MIQYGSSSTFYHHTFTDMESSMIQFLYILILIIAGITDLFYKKIYNRFPFLIAILALSLLAIAAAMSSTEGGMTPSP